MTQSETPSPLSFSEPAFRDRAAWGDFASPCVRDVGEEARWLGDPPIAVVSVVASKCGPAAALLVTSQGVFTDHERLMIDWLATIESSGPHRVPAPLRPYFGSHRALAVPMRSATWTVGALALPMRSGWGPIARELEGLGNDFAARFEAAHRRAEVMYLRVASVGRRPAGRRDDLPNTSRSPARLRAPSDGNTSLRGRIGRHVSGVRRLELPAGALGRDGTLALGRR